jgi:hypothetical protein
MSPSSTVDKDSATGEANDRETHNKEIGWELKIFALISFSGPKYSEVTIPKRIRV